MTIFRGDRLRYLRTHVADPDTHEIHTQTTLGKKIGVSKKQIGKWESNAADPQPMYLVRLAQLYGVTTDYLLDQSDKTVSEEGDPFAEVKADIVSALRRNDIGTLGSLVAQYIGQYLEEQAKGSR